jgi:hypothetical protein
VLAAIKASGSVTTTEVLAIIGAVSTPAVAFAGYWFNQRRAAQDRKANRELLQDTQQHERELAEGSHSHDRNLRQGERAYADRSTTYRQVIQWAFRTIQQVQLSEPILRTSDMPEPPENLSEEEWRTMMIEVRLFGSADVLQAMETFRESVSSFSGHLMVLRTYRDQGGAPGEQTSGAWRELQSAREEAATSFDHLSASIRDELASL